MLSRTADNLYWMSRYLERAEHTARLIDVHMNLLLDQSQDLQPDDNLSLLTQSLSFKNGSISHVALLQKLTFDSTNPASIVANVAAARENARQVREKISTEMWTHINRLYLSIRQADMERVWKTQPHEFFRAVKEGSHLFQGITDATLNHDEGWHFIQVGRFIERAFALTVLIDTHLGTLNRANLDQLVNNTDYFQWLGLLKAATAFEAYLKVYHANLRPDSITEFLLFDPVFPHSVRFCVEMIQDCLNDLSDAMMTSKNNRLHRTAGRLRSSLSFDEVNDILDGDLHTYLMDIQKQILQIHNALYETYITYPVESAIN